MTIDEDTGAHWRPASGGAYLLFTQHDSPAGPPLEDVPTSASFYFNLLRPESATSVARIAPFWRKAWQRNTGLWFLMAGQYTYTPDHRPSIFGEAWDGTRWRLQATPSPAGTLEGNLSGVSCAESNGKSDSPSSLRSLMTTAR